MTMTRVPDLEGVHNFRPLAPYPLRDGRRLREGMVYRSGALDQMTPADQRSLAEHLRIRRILDLRHADELRLVSEPHALMHCAVTCSFFPDELSQADLVAELNMLYGPAPSAERYLHYLQLGGDRIARAFSHFADEASYPILVHCVAGKDRTGVLVGMLMEVLGCDDEDIAREYALSNASLDRLIAYFRAIGRDLQGTDDEIRARFATPPERMTRFLQLLRERHGGAETFLRSQGITPAQIAKVRHLLAG